MPLFYSKLYQYAYLWIGGVSLFCSVFGLVQTQSYAQSSSCPEVINIRDLPPATEVQHVELSYWQKQWAQQFNMNEVLLDDRAITAHNQALNQAQDPYRGQILLQSPLDLTKVTEQVTGRLEYLRQQMQSEAYVQDDLSPISSTILKQFQMQPLTLIANRFHVNITDAQILCGPWDDILRKKAGDQSINRNSCSRIRSQAIVQVLMEWGNLWLIRTPVAIGWIPKSTPLSPQLTKEQTHAYLQGPFVYVTQTWDISGQKLIPGIRLPIDLTTIDNIPQRSIHRPHMNKRDRKKRRRLLNKANLWLANTQSVNFIESSEHVQLAPDTLTRAHFLKNIWSHLNRSYGLGGDQGGIDCSRLSLDVLQTYGLNVPRYSGHQAYMGTFSVDVSTIKEDKEKLALLDAAFKRGITFMYLPGHIAIYLGRNGKGTPMMFHAFADFQQVCDNGGESIVKVNKVSVTDVWRGQKSSKRSYLSRMTRMTVFGKGPGPALQGLPTNVQMRPKAAFVLPSKQGCKRTKNRARIFTSPAHPHQKQALKIMVTRPQADGPAQLAMIDQEQNIIILPTKRLGGPPYTEYAQIDTPLAGHWQLLYGEDQDWHACTHLKIRKNPIKVVNDPNIWTPQEEWSAHTETLFAAFVERLFQYPIDQDISWTNLQDLIKVKDHNLLYNHLSAKEDQDLRLQPDCADLPYTLRGYFAWKMKLPFSYMTCTRGSKRSAPRCMQREDSLQARKSKKPGKNFQWFARKGIAGHVHSASARTLPDDDETDLYPIALTREALRPGMVFADPYGHLLLIAGWQPQPLGGYGVLIGADGQPDGTIGRRRFWEGSFLFDPDTRLVGAGFKAFRPLILDLDYAQKQKNKKKKKKKNSKEDKKPSLLGYPWMILKNEDLTTKKVGDLAFSHQQYQGSRLNFYDQMSALSSPRPIQIQAHLNALADALFESARRRVLSVQNGEDHMLKHSRKSMKMPRGYSIFETSGPWEDFATPSRDMRLLIAIDTVLDLPQALARSPQRFGVNPSDIAHVQADLKIKLKKALKARTFEYVKTNGAKHNLSLQDLVDRQLAMEMAYNPNDCMEKRWGAPVGTEEYSTCKRHTPRSQVRKMKKYRSWFNERKRPPRGTR
jgi:hypothetical protein